MEGITPATLPRPRPKPSLLERPRVAYSTTTTPGSIRGFLKPKPEIHNESIAATGLLRAGRRLIPIRATHEEELQHSIRRHHCAGCKEAITAYRLTTSIEGNTPDGHYSDHHHWHQDCFRASETSNHEHALGRWAIINWEEN